MRTQMHSNLATFMIEQLQDKNHDSDDEHQKKEQEDPQETTLNEERVEQSASPTTAQQVKLHKMFPQNYNLITIKIAQTTHQTLRYFPITAAIIKIK